MLDQNTFVETVREVEEIIRISQEPLSKEKILSYFEDMELNEEQKEMVFAYFITPHDTPKGQADEEENQAASPVQNGGTPEPKSRVFQLYLEEMQALASYDRQEMEAFYERLLSGDQTVIKTISDAWLHRVLKTAKKLAPNAADLEDVIQEGNMALFVELTGLCGRGAGMDVEAALLAATETAMKKEISYLAGEEDEESAMIGRISLVNEARKYLAGENGREPSFAELLEYTRMAEDELKDVLSFIEKA